MFFKLANLGSMAVDPIDAPWDLKLETPAEISTKAEYQSWCLNPATKHAFVSAFEGLSPVIKIGKENPPVKMHGLIIDYDTRSVTPDRLRELADKPVCEWIPSYGSISFRKGGRLYWEFERPVPVSSGIQAKKFLERLCKELKVNNWLPGYDQGATLNIGQYYEAGREFVHIGGPKIRWDILAFWAWEAVRDTVLWTDFARYEIPLDAVEAEVHARFPGRWSGQFTVGSRGVRFWDPGADNPTGAQVRKDGVSCYTGDRPFMSWLDIFGKDFVSRFAASKTSELLEATYYDGKKFYSREGDSEGGHYVEWDKADFSQYLRTKGFDPSKAKGRTCSELDEAEIAIKTQRRVDYAKKIVHFPKGPVRWRGKNYLNMGAPTPIQPAPSLGTPLTWSDGAQFFPYIKSFLDVFFTDSRGDDEHNQRAFLFAWLRRFYQGGLELSPTQGQVAIIAGKPDKGKSFFCEGVVGGLMGGCEDGADYLVDNGRWSENVAESPVIYVGDSRAAEDHKTATAFANQLKKIVANATLRSAQKFSKETDVPWYGRIMISCNTDSESLNILPNLEISNRDKVMMFLASDVTFPFPERRESERRLAQELPFFGRFLLDWVPPHSVMSNSSRFGVDKFHHPFLSEASTSQGASGVLQDYLSAFIEADRISASGQRKGWTGSSTELYSVLSEFNPQFGKEFRTVRMFQTCLGQLKSREVLTIEKCKPKSGQTATWFISHDQEGGQE
jgi:hypothetical protein